MIHTYIHSHNIGVLHHTEVRSFLRVESMCHGDSLPFCQTPPGMDIQLYMSMYIYIYTYIHTHCLMVFGGRKEETMS